MTQSMVFLIDVDNTLLNNDQIKIEIKQTLDRVLGKEEANHFWRHHNSFRIDRKLVDFPSIIRAYCTERDADTCAVTIGSIFEHIRFDQALYPQALEAVEHLKTLGEIFVFSEGDMVYQRRKIEKSGIAAASHDVFLFEHKLDHLEKVKQQFGNSQLVFIDDRDDKLLEIKHRIPRAITLVVCQGHYAKEDCPMEHHADLVVGSVGELLQFSKETFFSRQTARR